MSQVQESFVIEFPGEDKSNSIRQTIGQAEPHSLRTYTPSQAVLAKSAGVFHWTPEGRRLYDYAAGVLVANLGHNPVAWMKRFRKYLGWTEEALNGPEDGFFQAVSMTAYNAITELEAEASRRLVVNLQNATGGSRLDTVMWAASGSEAVQKALWACMRRDPQRSGVLATRYGFHGKKGLSGAVTGSETDSERDPRVNFISFPREECADIENPEKEFDAAWYRQELEQVCDAAEHPIGCLITEPYLGGGGSYHPPKEYLQLLQEFCRERDILFILDEVQANFGRTGNVYAFETYGIEPDFVCLGKGLGNGVPVAAAVGRRDICELMSYGETSDTWSANPLSSAAVLATLDDFENSDIMDRTRHLSQIFTDALCRLKQTGVVAKVRGEGMVFGIECGQVGSTQPGDVANAVIERCYRGNDDNDGIHLLGPLAGCVIRIAPPMCMTDEQAEHSLKMLHGFVEDVAAELG
ncbi:aspartate aminotransferase family protein [Fuerstiella marisgermanici]|uniref:4-aminobutyrate aminotransferase GabT n=1 Tax=Fuerstiella marisgermanici TaxID=1891926 RepID=A0A1P8WRM3_9PLAN|nr:aspartate aminotransferase family protein [Fuerstiella marisgermanici]APZ96709.1 4-aminobutyrate aminotransferase GabT [Fuerstiella marisgermanici]